MFIFSDRTYWVRFMYNHSFTRYHSYLFSHVTKTIDGAKKLKNKHAMKMDWVHLPQHEVMKHQCLRSLLSVLIRHFTAFFK